MHYAVSKRRLMGSVSTADARSNQRDCKQSHGRPIAGKTRRSRTRRHTRSKVVRPFDRLAARGPARWSTSFAVNTAWEGLRDRSEEHTSELQSLRHLVCRLL